MNNEIEQLSAPQSPDFNRGLGRRDDTNCKMYNNMIVRTLKLRLGPAVVVDILGAGIAHKETSNGLN